MLVMNKKSELIWSAVPSTIVSFSVVLLNNFNLTFKRSFSGLS